MSRLRPWLWCRLAIAGLVLSIAPCQAQKRVALVIGNGTYAHAAPLPNPPKDAAAIGAAFKRLNFDHVVILKDLGAEALRRALLDFEPKVVGADIAVLYFAGHGIEVDGENFIIPVDARLARAAAAELEAVPLSTVTNVLSGARKLRLVILDACRTNPFSARMAANTPGGRKRSIGRGLSRVDPGDNELIAFAAAAGTEADDGLGEHSPFTASLLKHIETPGLDVRLLFGGVRDDVLTTTKRQQMPHVYGTLGRDPIYLRAAAAVSEIVPTPTEGEPPAAVDKARLDKLQEGYANWFALAQPVKGESHPAYIARMKQLVALAQMRQETGLIQDHWAIGVWDGAVKGAKLGADGPRRTLNIANVKGGGKAFGGWAASVNRAFGLGAQISIDGDRVRVTTQQYSIVTLQRSGDDKLVGTFRLRSGRSYPIALARQ
jgi:hypothetical protein